MSRLASLTLVFVTTMIAASAGGASAIGAAADAADGKAGPRTMTGWFGDAGCAAPGVAKGVFRPNNPDCVKACLKKGQTAVFISDQAEAMFEIRGYPAVADDVGWYVAVTGTVDESGKILTVTSVKRLEEHAATCAVPKKPKTTASKPTDER